MLIGFYINERGPLREAMYRLSEQFQFRGHTIRHLNYHQFNPKELEKFDGVFIPLLPDPFNRAQGATIQDAYGERGVMVFLLEHEADEFFIGDSPRVSMRHLRDLVEYLADDDYN